VVAVTISPRQMSDSSNVRRHRLSVLGDGSISLAVDDGGSTRVDPRDRINGVPARLFTAFDGRTVAIPALIINVTASHAGQAFKFGGAERSL
jgi:hypothetical protein